MSKISRFKINMGGCYCFCFLFWPQALAQPGMALGQPQIPREARSSPGRGRCWGPSREPPTPRRRPRTTETRAGSLVNSGWERAGAGPFGGEGTDHLRQRCPTGVDAGEGGVGEPSTAEGPSLWGVRRQGPPALWTDPARGGWCLGRPPGCQGCLQVGSEEGCQATSSLSAKQKHKRKHLPFSPSGLPVPDASLSGAQGASSSFQPTQTSPRSSAAEAGPSGPSVPRGASGTHIVRTSLPAVPAALWAGCPWAGAQARLHSAGPGGHSGCHMTLLRVQCSLRSPVLLSRCCRSASLKLLLP